MSLWYLLFMGVGRLLIFLGARFIEQNDIKIPFLHKLASCVLCSGTWVYTLMSLITGYVIFEDFGRFAILSELITGCCSAYLMYLVESGWKANYEVLIV